MAFSEKNRCSNCEHKKGHQAKGKLVWYCRLTNFVIPKEKTCDKHQRIESGQGWD